MAINYNWLKIRDKIIYTLKFRPKSQLISSILHGRTLLLLSSTLIINNNMSSRASSPLEILPNTPPTSTIDSQTSLPNAFGRIMAGTQSAVPKVVKDKCNRPTPTYNYNYNPDKVPRDNRPKGYSPYAFREPLYDDRLVITSRLPPRHTVAGAVKRPRTQ